jgi:GxxExxY protein
LKEEEIGRLVVPAAMKVHSAMGPGLLEAVYESCIAHELTKQRLKVERQVALPIEYGGMKMDAGYRLDLLINDSVIIELKAVEKLLPIHMAQLLTHLKLGGYKLGFLLNFNVVHMRDGVKRVVNGL